MNFRLNLPSLVALAREAGLPLPFLHTLERYGRLERLFVVRIRPHCLRVIGGHGVRDSTGLPHGLRFRAHLRRLLVLLLHPAWPHAICVPG